MTKEEALMFWKFRYEQAKDFIDEHWEAQERREHREYVDALYMAIEALQNEPVRCKECKWLDKNGVDCHNPRYGDGWANYPPPYVGEEYFCKDGERRGT